MVERIYLNRRRGFDSNKLITIVAFVIVTLSVLSIALSITDAYISKNTYELPTDINNVY